MNSQAPLGCDATASPSSGPSSQFQQDLVALVPHLRAFSRVLCGGQAIAEDMAQDALAKAWRSHDCFEPGTNLKAWLFTILRHEFYSYTRRAWRESQWDTALGDRIPAPQDEQDWTVNLSDAARALDELPEGQRDALILVAAGGFSYEKAAEICGAPVGTVKSRVARARNALSKILDGDKPLPQYSLARMRDTSEYLLTQLKALSQSDAQSGSDQSNRAA
jgi:RNA polymerase sigma-70 factor (ECF subfamily)